MSETFFPVNDLLRKKLQTALVILVIALCVASTHSMLILGGKIGFGLVAMTEYRLTTSFSILFSRFVIFVDLLVLIVGIVIISFMIFVMMSQRTRDIGLMKAVGCPSGLVFGYFMNELVIVSFVGCFLGVAIGALVDYASTILLSKIGLNVSQESINFWLAVIMFVLFFVLSLGVGAKPLLDATRVEPAKALSPSFSLGLSKESNFRGASKAGFTLKISLRGLFRHKQSSYRIILCMITTFLLITVTVAGGIIASQTTENWVESAIGRGVIVVAHRNLCGQYRSLLSRFYETKEITSFSYTEDAYLLSDNLTERLNSIRGATVEERLILAANVREIQGWMIDPDTLSTKSIGDNRQSASLVAGIQPNKRIQEWYMEGGFLEDDEARQAIVGDSLAAGILSRPLNQSVAIFDSTFNVVGVCLDPINNGVVAYVPLGTLQNITDIKKCNMIMIEIDETVDRRDTINQITSVVNEDNPNYEAVELDNELDQALAFLKFVWSMLMLVPWLCLVAVTLCLVGYVALMISDQRQEFGVLRAVGVRSRAITGIIVMQNLLVLLSGYAAGTASGIMITLLILIPQPIITSFTVLEIAGWLLGALVLILLAGSYPAVRFSRKPILEILT